MPHWSIFFCKSIKSSFGTGPSSSSTFELNLRWVKDLTGLACFSYNFQKRDDRKARAGLISTNRKRELSPTHLLCKYSTRSPEVPCDSYKDTRQFGTSQTRECSFPDTVSLSIVIHIWKVTFKKIVFLLFDIMMGLTVISSQFDDFTLTWFLVGRLRHIYW